MIKPFNVKVAIIQLKGDKIWQNSNGSLSVSWVNMQKFFIMVLLNVWGLSLAIHSRETPVSKVTSTTFSAFYVLFTSDDSKHSQHFVTYVRTSWMDAIYVPNISKDSNSLHPE